MNVAVIAPHPDDEVLGCGATIASHAAKGDWVYLIIVTKAYTPDWSAEFMASRPAEIAEASRILGIQQVYELDFPTVKLDTIPQKKLNDELSARLKEIQPDIVFIPHHGDLNRDHRLVAEAAMVAARSKPSRPITVLSYEVLSETEWGQQSFGVFVPNLYIDCEKTLEKKIAAMRAYQSELHPSPHPRSLEIITALARKRGSECGLNLAEAFMVIREIRV